MRLERVEYAAGPSPWPVLYVNIYVLRLAFAFALVWVWVWFGLVWFGLCCNYVCTRTRTRTVLYCSYLQLVIRRIALTIHV